MNEFKTVPVEPTAEMVEAAEDAYMPFGDMDLAIRMALLTAPDVHGEPVAYRVTGSYTDLPFKDESSAKAYCRGLLSGDPEGGYRITPPLRRPAALFPPPAAP